jgi:hypothetical protein
MIVNNVAGYSGAGISLQDTINARIINNTIANNDSTATVGSLIGGGDSDPQPAGISSGVHSLALGAAIGDPNGFSDPAPGSFINNIVWHNRAFYWNGKKLKPELEPTATGDCPSPADINTYWDLGVVGQPQANPAVQLDPRRSILSDLGIYAGGNNTAGDPIFLGDYCNGARSLTVPGPMGSIAAFGEGGNFLNVRWGPLTRAWPAGNTPWDYHVGAGIAVDTTWGGPATDFDNQTRPTGSSSTNRVIDRGADELLP